MYRQRLKRSRDLPEKDRPAKGRTFDNRVRRRPTAISDFWNFFCFVRVNNDRERFQPYMDGKRWEIVDRDGLAVLVVLSWDRPILCVGRRNVHVGYVFRTLNGNSRFRRCHCAMTRTVDKFRERNALRFIIIRNINGSPFPFIHTRDQNLLQSSCRRVST